MSLWKDFLAKFKNLNNISRTVRILAEDIKNNPLEWSFACNILKRNGGVSFHIWTDKKVIEIDVDSVVGKQKLTWEERYVIEKALKEWIMGHNKIDCNFTKYIRHLGRNFNI